MWGSATHGEWYYDTMGNEACVYKHSLSAYLMNTYGWHLFDIGDTVQWTVNRKTKKFGPFNYTTGALSYVNPWWSPWRTQGSKDSSMWYDGETQKEATSAVGAGFGIGLSGGAEASQDSSKATGSLSVTIGCTAAYWGSTSINTCSGYSTHVDLDRWCCIKFQ